jgi:hypothetical protein
MGSRIGEGKVSLAGGGSLSVVARCAVVKRGKKTWIGC